MAVLENNREENFAQGLVRGLSQIDAFHDAFENSLSWADSTVGPKASRLAKKPAVAARVQELQQASATAAVMDRMERMLTLSAMARDVELHPKQRMQAIDILNKMDGEYVQKIEAKVDNDLKGAAVKVAAILNE